MEVISIHSFTLTLSSQSMHLHPSIKNTIHSSMGYQNPMGFWPGSWQMICAMTIAVEFMVPLLSFGVHRLWEWKKGAGMMVVKTNHCLGQYLSFPISGSIWRYIEIFWIIWRYFAQYVRFPICFALNLDRDFGCSMLLFFCWLRMLNWDNLPGPEVLPFRSHCTCECPDDDHCADRHQGWSAIFPGILQG